jgi:hypothetical protein
MRPIHPHAADSGVGKHTARESERAQACAAGKEQVANAHPQNLASGPHGPGALFFYAPCRLGRGSRNFAPAQTRS